MKAADIKSEINKVIDSIPEDALEEILNYLKSIQNISSTTISRSQLLKKIITEDKQLLEKLAK